MKWVVTAAMFALCGCAPAAAQPVCGDRSEITARLASKYGERPAGMGLSHSNTMIELFVSDDTGTWTVLLTTPSGRTCLVSAGEYWQAAPRPVDGGDL